jgi:hypothetical protein
MTRRGKADIARSFTGSTATQTYRIETCRPLSL